MNRRACYDVPMRWMMVVVLVAGCGNKEEVKSLSRQLETQREMGETAAKELRRYQKTTKLPNMIICGRHVDAICRARASCDPTDKAFVDNEDKCLVDGMAVCCEFTSGGEGRCGMGEMSTVTKSDYFACLGQISVEFDCSGPTELEFCAGPFIE